MALRIDVLGTTRIEVDGAPLRVDTRKATALLAYLAVTGGSHSRDLLVDLLWPDADPDRGRAALRRTLSVLRSALGGRWLAADRSAVGLDLEPDAIDAWRFRRLVSEAGSGPGSIPHLSQAVALHRGELLAGFGLRDSAAFDDWQRAAGAEFRRELELALERLVAELAGCGRPGEALAPAQRRLALDPLHEPAQRALILLYAVTGHRAEALAQYRSCVRVLDRELGVRPLPETSALYDAVSEGLPVAWPDLERRPEPAVAVAELGLVGREAELEQLAAAVGPGGRLLVVEGEPGVGKTRLCEGALEAVRGAGGTAVQCRSHEGEAALPFGLIAAVLRAAAAAGGADRLASVQGHWRAEAARLVPELGDVEQAAGDGPGAQQRLHEGLAQVVSALLCDADPGLLFLDDLQFADPASLDMIAYLGRRLDDRPLTILVAWRSEEIGPEHAPLRRLAVQVIRLGRLSREHVVALAAQAGAPEHAARLWQETEGLPLFVVEYLAALRLPEPTDELPSGVRELLTARLDSVGETASQLISAAAVIGRSFDLETLREASGRGDEETADGLEQLTRRGLIVERAAGYDFSHDKLRSLAYQRTSLARRRLLHRRVADALRARHGDAALIARHLLSAGMDAQAAEAFQTAGERARALHATSEALDAYRSALALGASEPAALHEAIGDLHALRGEYAAALQAYEAAAATGPADLAGIEHKLGRVHDRRGDPELAERHLLAALELGGESARVQVDRSLVAHRRGDGPAAVGLADRALELAGAAGDLQAIAQAHNLLGMLTGETEHLQRSVELAEDLPDPSVLVAALNNLALASDDGELAIALTERALRLSSEQGDRHREAALNNNLADLLHRAGREHESMGYLKRAVTIFAEIGSDEGGMQPGVWKLVEW
jgi:DNA-binding SARP family transcriptional activator/tetratricopeptide (TPR) repeat protein